MLSTHHKNKINIRLIKIILTPCNKSIHYGISVNYFLEE